MKKIFIINGSNESGKNTFVEMIDKHAKQTFVKYISSIDWVKEFCEIEYGVNPNDKTEKNRRLWHQEKQYHQKYIFYNIINQIDKLDDHYSVFLDIRETDEIEMYKFIYPEIITILIKNPNVVVADNYADKHVENYKYNKIINNNDSLDSLNQKAIDFVK